MTTTAAEMTKEVRLIELSTIDPPKWNSRTIKQGQAAKEDNEKLVELAASMTANGQMQPIEVESVGDRFELVFGSRRVAAAKLNGWTQILATVRPTSDENQRVIRNIEENERRRNLTTFEQARAFARLREMGLQNADIATKLGASKSHVSNQINTFTKLPDVIKEEWARNHPAATFDFLREVSMMDTDEKKVRAWDDRVSELAAQVAAGGKAGKRGKGKGKTEEGRTSGGFSLSSRNMNIAIDQLSSRKVADEKIGGTRKWAYDLLLWVMNQRKTPPEGITIPVKADKADKADKGK